MNQKQQIAADAKQLVKDKGFRPAKSGYLSIPANQLKVWTERASKYDDGKTRWGVLPVQCQVCVLGAALLAYIQRYNGVPIEPSEEDAPSVLMNNLDKLESIFTLTELENMEAFFEANDIGNYGGQSRIEWVRLHELEKETSPEQRFDIIMDTILENGHFNVERAFDRALG